MKTSTFFVFSQNKNVILDLRKKSSLNSVSIVKQP